MYIHMTDHLTQGGHLKPDPYNAPASIAAEYGLEAAREAAAFEASQVQALKDFVEKEGIDCDFVMTRATDVEMETPIRDRLKAGYDKLVADDVSATKTVSYCGEETAEAVCSFTSHVDHIRLMVLLDIRSQRCKRLLLVQCWPSLPLQAGPPPPLLCYCPRRQPPNPNTRCLGV